MYEAERGLKNDRQREAQMHLTLDQNDYYNECLDQLRENLRTRRKLDAQHDRLKREFQLELLSRWQAAQAMHQPDIRWEEMPSPIGNQVFEEGIRGNQQTPIWTGPLKIELETPHLDSLEEQLGLSIKHEQEKKEEDKFKAPF